MPTRPFPFPLGIGTDIVHVSRISGLVGSSASPDKPKLQQFLNRFLTYREQRDFRSRYKIGEVALQTLDPQTARYLAGRWAAKEATIKAVHPRRLMLMDIEILRYPSFAERKGVFALIRDTPGSPKPFDHKFAAHESASSEAEAKAAIDGIDYDQLEGQIAKISISHDGEYATAVCLAANEALAGDVGGEAAARMP